MHLGFNLFVLMQIGPLVERSFGTGRFLFTYVLAGVGAAVIPAMLSAGQGIPVGWTVGASGAIFGLIGLSLVFGHRVGTPEGRHVRDEMIKWTVYTTVFGLLMGGVAHGRTSLGWLAGPVWRRVEAGSLIAKGWGPIGILRCRRYWVCSLQYVRMADMVSCWHPSTCSLARTACG